MIDFKGKQATLGFDVAIIGAGFCGSTLATRLARESELRIALIDATARFGLGPAYGTERPEHLLNVVAGRMSAYAEEPNHFLDWLHVNRGNIAGVWPGRVSANDFLPRLIYGRYLQAQLQNAMGESKTICTIAQSVVDLKPGANGCTVVLSNGQHVRAQSCVLATGMPRQGQALGLHPRIAASPRYIAEPWGSEVLSDVGKPRQVVLIGSGLTAVDVALSSSLRHPEATITMISRHGRLPKPHLAPFTPAVPMPQDELKMILSASTLRDVVCAFRKGVAGAEASGGDWHRVMDAVRPHIQRIWQKLTIDDRRRFLRHLRSVWESHRHRAAPWVASRMTSLIRSGKLEVRAGRILAIDGDQEQATVTYLQPAKRIATILEADVVVNCTGPHGNVRNLDDQLWQKLLARGVATPDALGLGIEVDEDGRLINGAGHTAQRLFALGFLRRSALYESTAVPELRVQVKCLADRLITDRRSAALAG